MAVLDDFRITNLLRISQRTLHILLAFLFIGGVNYLATSHYQRFDLTSQNRYSLSPETIAYLQNLKVPVHVIVTIPPDSPRADESLLYNYTQALLAEYQYHAPRRPEKLLTIEYVDVYQQLARAEALATNYQISDPNLILFVGPERTRILTPTEIVEFEEREITAFKGEQAFTSALLEVSTDRQPVIYFLIGHGEMSVDSVNPNRGLSAAALEMRARNFALRPLDLTKEKTVPVDADLLILADPQTPLLPSEVEKLRAYLEEDAGRLVAMLGPAKEHGLDELLFQWGIRADDMVVLERGEDYQESTGNLLLRQFGNHPVTELLIANQTPVVTGLCRPVRQDPTAPLDARLTLTEILATSNLSYAERSYLLDSAPVFDPAADLPGPIPVATISEREAPSQLGIDLPGGRLVVFGTSDLFSNRLLASLGNQALLFGVLNWALDREQLLALPPRERHTHHLPLSREERWQLVLVLLSLPAVIAVGGLIVHWRRRH